MYIERILLQRFCQHTDREIVFSPGLNVIVGPIGSGKSNILKAIRLAFTNDSGNPGKKEEDIQTGSDPSMPSSVSLTGTHREQRFFITRKLRPSSREFYWEGSDNKLRSEKAIADELQTRMGVDVSMFDEFVIVPQGDIANIIDMDDAKRTEAMHNLVGLSKYSKYYAWMSDYLTTLVVPVVPESADEIANQLTKHKEQLALLTIDLQALQQGEASSADLQKANQILASRSLVVSLNSKIEATGKSLDEANKSLKLWTDHRQVVEAGVKAATETLAIHRRDEASILASIAAAQTWELYDSYSSRIQSFQAACVEPIKPGDYVDPNSPEVEQQKALQSEISVLNHLKSLIASGKPACPVCLRPVEQEMKDCLNKLPGLTQQLQALEDRVLRSNQYRQAHANWVTAKAAAEAAIPELRKSQESLGLTSESVRPTMNAAALSVGLTQIRKQLEQVTAIATTNQEALTKAHTSIAAFSAQIQTLEAELASAQQQLLTVEAVDDAAYQAAVLATTQAAQLKEAIATKSGESTATQALILGLEERLGRAIKARNEAETISAFRADVEKSRGLFHRDKLPFELAKNGMLALAARMNEVLTALSADFRVHAGNGSSFKASFYNQPGKGIQPDWRLSGGERAQYGWALRVASHSLWAQELGFLAMDEPTYGFGPNDIGCVRVGIEELRRLSSEQGLQVIVVTHERSLLPMFDNVIEV